MIVLRRVHGLPCRRIESNISSASSGCEGTALPHALIADANDASLGVMPS